MCATEGRVPGSRVRMFTLKQDHPMSIHDVHLNHTQRATRCASSRMLFYLEYASLDFFLVSPASARHEKPGSSSSGIVSVTVAIVITAIVDQFLIAALILTFTYSRKIRFDLAKCIQTTFASFVCTLQAMPSIVDGWKWREMDLWSRPGDAIGRWRV